MDAQDSIGFQGQKSQNRRHVVNFSWRKSVCFVVTTSHPHRIASRTSKPHRVPHFIRPHSASYGRIPHRTAAFRIVRPYPLAAAHPHRRVLFNSRSNFTKKKTSQHTLHGRVAGFIIGSLIVCQGSLICNLGEIIPLIKKLEINLAGAHKGWINLED